jgi:hypothetical protein
MKFTLPLTTAISAAILASTSCGNSSDGEWKTSANTRVCVDQSGKRMPEDQCVNQPSTTIPPYRWYYISRDGYVPTYNGPVSGGSYYPTVSPDSYSPAPSTARAGAITRGGFGGSAEGGEGHAGGGEGAGE